MSNFLDNIYGVLFHPSETFERMKENPPIFQGFIIVIFISILKPILNLDFSGGFLGVMLFGFRLFGSIFGGILGWFLLVLFFDIVANIFKQGGKTKLFSTLFAFALVPWIFSAPVELLKTGSSFTKIFAMFFGLLVLFWVIVLVIKAVIKAYELSFGRALILTVVPFLGGFLALYLFMSFLSALFQILRV